MVFVPFVVFGVCFRLLPLSRVLSSCVGSSPLFCFFHCLRVLVGPFPSACPHSDLRFPLGSGPLVRPRPWLFNAFPALFPGVPALPLSSVGWFRSFFCGRLFAIFLRFFFFFFFFVVVLIFFLLGPLSDSLSHPSSGPPLGSCVPLFGFWPVCLPLGFSSHVSPCCGPPGCFFKGFPPLPVLLSTFSPVARSL